MLKEIPLKCADLNLPFYDECFQILTEYMKIYAKVFLLRMCLRIRFLHC